jgi:hypothetical protein
MRLQRKSGNFFGERKRLYVMCDILRAHPVGCELQRVDTRSSCLEEHFSLEVTKECLLRTLLIGDVLKNMNNLIQSCFSTVVLYQKIFAKFCVVTGLIRSKRLLCKIL